MRRPWPNAQGATHLVLDPLDFLRRLAALVSLPYSHQVRYHGVFANRSRLRRYLPPPPLRREDPDIEDAGVRVVSSASRSTLQLGEHARLDRGRAEHAAE